MSPRDESQLNASASSRRRLLKALGLGAVATQLSLDWVRPSLRFGALPAHAQSTLPEECNVGYSLTFDCGGSFNVQPYREDSNGSTYFQSFTGDDETITTAYIYQQPPSQTVSLLFLVNVDGEMTFSGSAECCETNGFAYSGTLSGSGTREFVSLFTTDPGQCSFPV